MEHWRSQDSPQRGWPAAPGWTARCWQASGWAPRPAQTCAPAAGSRGFLGLQCCRRTARCEVPRYTALRRALARCPAADTPTALPGAALCPTGRLRPRQQLQEQVMGAGRSLHTCLHTCRWKGNHGAGSQQDTARPLCLHSNLSPTADCLPDASASMPYTRMWRKQSETPPNGTRFRASTRWPLWAQWGKQQIRTCSKRQQLQLLIVPEALLRGQQCGPLPSLLAPFYPQITSASAAIGTIPRPAV